MESGDLSQIEKLPSCFPERKVVFVKTRRFGKRAGTKIVIFVSLNIHYRRNGFKDLKETERVLTALIPLVGPEGVLIR